MILEFNKNSFNIEEIDSKLEDFCIQEGIKEDKLLKMQSICEEFLSNILFPNYEGMVKLSAFQKDDSVMLLFEYEGFDYMDKVNEINIISHKILQNKSKEIVSNTNDGKTVVSFAI